MGNLTDVRQADDPQPEEIFCTLVPAWLDAVIVLSVDRGSEDTKIVIGSLP